mgnify:CR=1 FL=1
MSTRGWYEYYVLDDARKEMSLALQFYKWGDATPGNALCELADLRDMVRHLGGKVPVQLVHHLLADNLGELVVQLPPTFALGYYFFLLQRGEEEQSPFRRVHQYSDKKDNPAYRLGFAVGRASERKGFEAPRTNHPAIDLAHFSIEVGMLVRRWSQYALETNVLSWLQYITQVTEEVDMGSILGGCGSDAHYLYRFFFQVPRLERADQLVTSIHVEPLRRDGTPLSSGTAQDELEPGEDEQLRRDRARLRSLTKLQERYELVPSVFWRRRLIRTSGEDEGW